MILSWLRRIHDRLEYWIEKLEERQPSGPCDPLVAADVARLSRRILEHSKTVNPYTDMVAKEQFQAICHDYMRGLSINDTL